MAWWFLQRTRKYFSIVLRQGLGITDYWLRFEFAKSRGMTHFHALLWHHARAPLLHGLLDHAAAALNCDELGERLVAAAADVATHAREIGVSALHPGGAANGAPQEPTLWHAAMTRRGNGVAPTGNISRWPPPEGTQVPPQRSPIRCEPFAVDAIAYGAHAVDIFNRIGLHRCSSYCQKFDSKKKAAEAAKWEEWERRKRTRGADRAGPRPRGNRPVGTCRVTRAPMGDPDSEPWAFAGANPRLWTRGAGLPQRSAAGLECVRSQLRLLMERDHPRGLQGLQLLLQIQQCNVDFQLVLAPHAPPAMAALRTRPPGRRGGARRGAKGAAAGAAAEQVDGRGHLLAAADRLRRRVRLQGWCNDAGAPAEVQELRPQRRRRRLRWLCGAEVRTARERHVEH